MAGLRAINAKLKHPRMPLTHNVFHWREADDLGAIRVANPAGYIRACAAATSAHPSSSREDWRTHVSRHFDALPQPSSMVNLI